MKKLMVTILAMLLLFGNGNIVKASTSSELEDVVSKYNAAIINAEEVPNNITPLEVNSLEELEGILRHNAELVSEPEITTIARSNNFGVVTPNTVFPPISLTNSYKLYDKWPMAVLVSEVQYTYRWDDYKNMFQIISIDSQSIYFESSVSCTFEQESYTATKSSNGASIAVYVRGNIYQTIGFDGNYIKTLVKRIDTTYNVAP